jgi:hypothetical protein
MRRKVNISTLMVFRNQRRRTQWPKEKVQIKHTYKSKDRESSLRKFYGRHHDLVDRYNVSVSQMTTDMFHLS